MKVLLVYPRFSKLLDGHPWLRVLVDRHFIANYTMPPSLALPIIASITPPEVEIELCDDNIGQDFDEGAEYSLAAISCFTPQAQRAYEIADSLRERGIPVIMGGIHPTMMPQEALLHADSVCVGEVESVWSDVIRDLSSGGLKRLYRADQKYDLAQMPVPKRDIFCRNSYKWNAQLILTTRGCPVRCSGCPVPGKEGYFLRFRPAENVINEISSMGFKDLYFADDTVMIPAERTKNYLFSILDITKELEVDIFIASTMKIYSDKMFLSHLRSGGVSTIYMVFGFDEVSKGLLSPGCSRDNWKRGVDLVRNIRTAGINIFASFGLGFDYQDKGVFEKVLRFSAESGVDVAEFFINTPFPGTPFGARAVKEERVLHRNYELWNAGNVVFRPRNFTEKELMDGFVFLWEHFYSGRDPDRTSRVFKRERTK